MASISNSQGERLLENPVKEEEIVTQQCNDMEPEGFISHLIHVEHVICARCCA